MGLAARVEWPGTLANVETLRLLLEPALEVSSYLSGVPSAPCGAPTPDALWSATLMASSGPE